MASTLEDCTIQEQRSVIRFLVAEGVEQNEIFCRMLIRYGKSCMNRENFDKWVDRFKSGQTTTDDEDTVLDGQKASSADGMNKAHSSNS